MAQGRETDQIFTALIQHLSKIAQYFIGCLGMRLNDGRRKNFGQAIVARKCGPCAQWRKGGTSNTAANSLHPSAAAKVQSIQHQIAVTHASRILR